jgi:hypothetical protein
VDSVHKNAAATVPVERVIAFLHTITNLVLEVVPDRKQKLLFLERLRLITGRDTVTEPAVSGRTTCCRRSKARAGIRETAP